MCKWIPCNYWQFYNELALGAKLANLQRTAWIKAVCHDVMNRFVDLFSIQRRYSICFKSFTFSLVHKLFMRWFPTFIRAADFQLNIGILNHEILLYYGDCQCCFWKVKFHLVLLIYLKLKKKSYYLQCVFWRFMYLAWIAIPCLVNFLCSIESKFSTV